MPNPLDPLSFGSETLASAGPGPRPRDVSSDMVGGVPGSSCGCSNPKMMRGKVLLGLALVGAAAYAYRYR